MATGLHEFLARLCGAIGQDALADATDAELLRRYAGERDEGAFAELVHRHAPAVYAVCRKHLSDPHTLDDAFQAVFVVLARKADAITNPEKLTAWVFGVAERVSRKARVRQAKQAAREHPLGAAAEPPASSAEPETDLRAVLDDELAKLPAEYREAVVLCDVDGLTRRAAARQLGIPESTLSNRLTRARAMLGRRLLRRGVALGAGATLVSPVAGVVPARLVDLATSAACADATPAHLVPLLHGASHPMSYAKMLLIALAGTSALGAVATGVIALSRGMISPPPAEQAANGGKPQSIATRLMSAADLGRQPKPRIAQDRSGAVALTPDCTRIAIAPNDWSVHGTKVVVYDTATWKEVASLDMTRHRQPFVAALGISADGKRVFVVPKMVDPEVRVWDTVAGRYEEKRLDIVVGRHDRVQLKSTPDGRTLIGSFEAFETGKHTMRVWEVQTGRLIRTLDMPPTGGIGFVFADGGKTIATLTASGGRNNPRYEVVEWAVDTGEEKTRIDVRAAVGTDRGAPLGTALAYTADGKQVVVAGGFTLPETKLNEAMSNEIVSNFPWSGSVWVIDRGSGKVVQTLVQARHDLVRSLHPSADGRKLFINPTLPSRWDRTYGGPTGTDHEFVEIQRWDVGTWELDWVKIVPKTERWRVWAGDGK